MSDRDQAPTAEEEEEDSPTLAAIREQFQMLVLSPCDACGRQVTWTPVGVATLAQWRDHFAALLGTPFVCDDCRATVAPPA